MKSLIENLYKDKHGTTEDTEEGKRKTFGSQNLGLADDPPT